MNKFLSLIDVLRKGSAVADPALWKNRSAIVIALAALIMAAAAAAKAFGYDFPIDNETALGLAGGIAAVVGLLGNFATSDKVGILPAKPGEPVDLSAGPVGDPAPSAERDGPQ